MKFCTSNLDDKIIIDNLHKVVASVYDKVSTSIAYVSDKIGHFLYSFSSRQELLEDLQPRIVYIN